MPKKFPYYFKLPKTYKGKMNVLKQILEDNQSYPPSEQVWNQILGIVFQEITPEEELRAIQAKIRKETDRYKPSLPEPLLARFYHHGVYYYLDGKNNLYQHDPGNALVGNLVGHVEEKDEVVQVIVRGKELLTIPKISVNQTELYHRTYYLDKEKKTYRGFHPQSKFLYLVGRLNHENKIELARG